VAKPPHKTRFAGLSWGPRIKFTTGEVNSPCEILRNAPNLTPHLRRPGYAGALLKAQIQLKSLDFS
jgi:hypothetical protein